MTTAGTAIAATAPAQAPGAGVSMAGAGDSQTVRYGKAFRISGRAVPSERVRLERAAGGRSYAAVATTTAAADGTYGFTVRARRSASYRAVPEDGGSASGSRRVTVLAKIGGRARKHVLGVQGVAVRGTLLPRTRGKTIRLQRASGGRWRTVDRVRTGRGGRFRATFKPSAIGSHRLRVRFAGDRSAAAAGKRLPTVRVYRAGHASWYGPGFYGNTTACGGTLGTGTLGVAHKYLPCGTKVTFRYRGRSVTVPVIDRGPYAAGRDWDLTGATKARLGFGSTGTVWSTK